MSYTRDHDKRPDDRWYEKNPLAKGKGLGLVLHEKSGRWTVVSVLRESPAERAGVRTGDVLVRVEDYALKGGDSLELVCLIRSGMQKERFEVVLDRKQEGEVSVPITPKSMMRILARHGRLNGGFGIGQVCRTCNLCLPAFAGFAECGLESPDPFSGKRCSSPCMLA
ncbi:MAG: PDZ domain-containing protein [Gemmatimonadaceae bacterium]